MLRDTCNPPPQKMELFCFYKNLFPWRKAKSLIHKCYLQTSIPTRTAQLSFAPIWRRPEKDPEGLKNKAIYCHKANQMNQWWSIIYQPASLPSRWRTTVARVLDSEWRMLAWCPPSPLLAPSPKFDKCESHMFSTVGRKYTAVKACASIPRRCLPSHCVKITERF